MAAAARASSRTDEKNPRRPVSNSAGSVRRTERGNFARELHRWCHSPRFPAAAQRYRAQAGPRDRTRRSRPRRYPRQRHPGQCLGTSVSGGDPRHPRRKRRHSAPASSTGPATSTIDVAPPAASTAMRLSSTRPRLFATDHLRRVVLALGGLLHSRVHDDRRAVVGLHGGDGRAQKLLVVGLLRLQRRRRAHRGAGAAPDAVLRGHGQDRYLPRGWHR